MAYGSGPTVGIAKSDYALKTRQLIKLITDLRALGAQSEIDLPRIAVIGNQSAGKSSLVEAISGINVPRASGTCTRCPMECRLQNSSGPWKCQVLLRLEKDESGQPVPDVQEVNFGPIITDKAKLEDTLRRAQLAILNPSVDYKSFIDFDIDRSTPGQPPLGSRKLLQFSSNVVCLNIYGPDVVDLAFIDLPGIISNVADGEDRNNIKLVQGLVKDHIKGNALILLTLTMRDDLENQSAAFLAKEVDPDGMRTIGVLTKADAVLPGEESAWLQVLAGERHPLKHGYYVTKQPGPDDLAKKLSFDEARERERSFFADADTWKSTSPRIKSRTGVPNLTKELSRLLSRLIIQTLPKLRKDAQLACDGYVKALAQLPPTPPDNPVSELLRLITAFSKATGDWINGADGCERLIQSYRAANADFKAHIRETAPDFRPFESAKIQKALNPDFLSAIEDDPLSNHIGGSKSAMTMYLPEVRDYVQRSFTRQLPYNVPFSAKRSLITRSFHSWNGHASTYFEVVCQATTELLDELIDDHFSRFVMSPLRDHVKNIMNEQVKQCSETTTGHIAWFLDLEMPPFTQNDHYFSSLREKYLSKYRSEQQKPTHQLYSPEEALSKLSLLGFHGLTGEDLYKLSPPDKFEEELQVMAEVSAYVRVAYKRVIDDVPRIVDHDFFHALGKRVQQALIDGVGLDGKQANERATMYLMEDPVVVTQREDLQAKKLRAEEVMKKLFAFDIRV